MNDSLGRFDDLIRGEREQIARERDAQAAKSSGEAAGEAASAGAGSSTPGTREGDMKQADPNDEQSTAQNSPGDMKSDASKSEGGGGVGTGTQSGGGPGTPSRDIPDGSDDDIIARQIREAAEKETDPELKDKLWTEYIEYKKNAKK